jgi:hypothetical protein
MSKEYIVLLVDEPENEHSIDGQSAQVFMRFYEPPPEDYLQSLSRLHPGKRVYSLMGASMWHST